VTFPKTFIISPISPHAYYTGEVEWVNSTFGVLLVTCPEDIAKAIAMALLEKRLAASVNMIPAVSSLYWWRDKIESSLETLLLIKTRVDAFENIKKVVEDMHPYEVPQIVLLPIVAGSEDYLSWIDRELNPRPEN
jgi:periplasmic divalent cation tolerance protein